MKAALIMLLLACTMAAVYGDLVCGTKFCKTVNCAGSASKSSCRHPSVYRAAHSGQCGCCPACVTLLNENDACKVYSKELGETPLAVCREPMKCLRGVCTKIVPRK